MQGRYLLWCLAAAAAANAVAVHELTIESFDTFVAKHELSLISCTSGNPLSVWTQTVLTSRPSYSTLMLVLPAASSSV
jgi:hypothetical protein